MPEIADDLTGTGTNEFDEVDVFYVSLESDLFNPFGSTFAAILEVTADGILIDEPAAVSIQPADHGCSDFTVTVDLAAFDLSGDDDFGGGGFAPSAAPMDDGPVASGFLDGGDVKLSLELFGVDDGSTLSITVDNFQFSAVPEPSSAVLVSLFGLVTLARRRARCKRLAWR